jgi:glucose-1-phosphate thymidylyltransferase
MNLIIPMAGMGKRMRPHTLQIPKPLLKIAGRTIVERIVEDINSSCGKRIEEVHFIIGNFGCEVENRLLEIANKINAKGFIHYQNEALGTAHAVYCANEGLNNEILIAFADTLFVGDFEIGHEDEAIIWTMKVENPQNYGVVTTDDSNNIIEFVEKPVEFISDRAIIGIYYFKDGRRLMNDIQVLIDSEFKTSGEYQLTDNLKNLRNAGLNFKCKSIDEWLDCGNKDEFLKSNKRLLELGKYLRNKTLINNCNISIDVYFGNNVEIFNSTIGPYVSIGDNCKIIDSEIYNSIVGSNCNFTDCYIIDSMVGNFNSLKGISGKVNFGDFIEYDKI